MTPLAQAIANDACLPVGKRRFGNLADEIGLFDGLHFFECSAVYETACAISGKLARDRSSSARQMTFLAAPRMLIDCSTPEHEMTSRQAFLLEQNGETARVTILLMARSDGLIVRVPTQLFLPLIGSDEPFGSYKLIVDRHLPRCDVKPAMDRLAAGLMAVLAMINTPRIINRQQHMPHRGLERKLAGSRGMVGKFPLNAWTELKLEVRPPRDATDDGNIEAHLTGQKAFHFCRTHLRVRLGKLELVSAHWRGDPALGIKQTRYAVMPPKDGAWPKWAAQHGATP